MNALVAIVGWGSVLVYFFFVALALMGKPACQKR